MWCHCNDPRRDTSYSSSSRANKMACLLWTGRIRTEPHCICIDKPFPRTLDISRSIVSRYCFQHDNHGDFRFWTQEDTHMSISQLSFFLRVSKKKKWPCDIYRECVVHWNGNVIILTKFSSLAALKVVILTTFGAASDENFIKMMTFSFQWYRGGFAL